ncbi:5-methylcytosine-specific restriction protein A [Agromyces flavus]|uniref:5-methylcytosine-specific restriction protein A n=1 Tax=Agromyces flavus TaxID=589382 RepID=A0A1H2A328_9MICO|nr:hypothetical protein [Agromyces flavus]MCP2367386.1 5-methylcytosine-specific restriction protein A [Agromyces flavus]SDT39896.1 hypothetical protein SAMN04489721_3464 [Agromyces flavus]
MTSSPPFRFTPGDFVTRRDLAIEYGGSTQGGIVASRQSNMVFLFTDPAHGSQFGYVYDGFADDGSAYYYTGAGQSGDQVLTHSNAPIAKASQRGSAIQLFAADGFIAGTGTKRQRYIGEFVLDPSEPVQRMPAHSADGKEARTVLVFRLLPVTELPPQLVDVAGRSQLPSEPFAIEVPTEINSAEFFETAGTPGQIAVRRESDLVTSFLSSQPDREFSRWAINLPAERTRLLTDVYDERDRILYEAKAIAGRSDLRMAVGQLYDYRRHIEVADLRCSVLLPARPSADLRDLLLDAGLGLVFKEHSAFTFEFAGTPRAPCHGSRLTPGRATPIRPSPDLPRVR